MPAFGAGTTPAQRVARALGLEKKSKKRSKKALKVARKVRADLV